MSTLLFLHGGPDQARDVYRQERRGYWSVALPTVLEKHGYLAVEEIQPPEFLGSVRRPGVAGLLVARLPADAWTPELCAAVLDGPLPVLLEGPLPRQVQDRLGISSAVPGAIDGILDRVSAPLATAARAFGYPAGGRVSPPSVREIDRDVDMDWSSLPGVPITAEQSQAWRSPGWDVEYWSLDGQTEVLADWATSDGKRYPAVIRRGRISATCLSLFAMLGQAHTSEPWYHREYRSSGRVSGLEHLLLALIDELYREAGSVRPRVLPWPRGAKWVLNVRHDFDRFISPERVAGVLNGHDRCGTAATWYWRSRHLRSDLVRQRGWKGNKAIRAVAAHPRSEVAHHTERLWAGAEREQRIIEAVIRKPVAGTCSHGDPHCFRYQGAPNILWAERQHLLYTELVQQAHMQPHRFAALASNGQIAPLTVISLPHHESLDRSTAPGQAATERVERSAHTYEGACGLLQVMNHPDINNDELFDVLLRLPSDSRLDWTAAQAADWWNRSHVRDHLRLLTLPNGDVRVSSQLGVEGLVVELLEPSADCSSHIVNLQPGAATTLSVS